MNMNTNLNFGLNFGLRSKSLACWFLIAASCPHVLMLSPANAQTAVSANPPSPADVLGVASRITDIDTNVAGDRLNLVLNFASSDRPQVTYTRQGKAWIALLNGAQLQLNNGNASYAKANPVPGVTAIEATQYAANRVRIRVTANDPEMFKDLFKRQDSGDRLTFSLEMQPSATQSNTISAANLPEAGVINGTNNTAEPNRAVVAQNTTQGVAQNTAVSSSLGKPLFEPKITIVDADGKTRVAQANNQTVPPPVANPVTPQLPGRVQGVVPPFRQLRTPPVGDIATTTAKLRPDIVELGTAERVPRITLRNAPAIEVLTLIGRVAGLSVVSTDVTGATASAPAAAGATATATSINQPVSLDIENEPAQDVFNNVLRITGLEANRIGNTIFVGTKLPVTLKNLVIKSYRLNQITVGEASAYLYGLGATRIVNRLRPIPGASSASVSSGATVVNTPTELIPTLESLPSSRDSGTTPLLTGLQVIAEERSSSITLIGTPQQVAFAETQLGRLDLRKPQVAVNVRIVDVSLDRDQTVGSLLGFNASNPDGSGTRTAFSSDQGALSINFNNNNPGASPSIFTNPQRLFSLITAQIQSGSAKVVSEPTLVVQEGQEGQIDIGDEILTISETGKLQKSTAGLKLSINVNKIDDNGFIILSILPEVSVIGGVRTIDTRSVAADGTVSGFTGAVDLLTKRAIRSGQIRMRDGQSLVLSGVIQDTDRESVSKVPILGDLPIIGALFRSTQSINSRAEVIIIVTPRIMDDSQNATWGYTYQPGPEVQRVLDSNKIKPQ